MPSTSWFGRSIEYSFQIATPKDGNGEMTDMDFRTWSEFKTHIHQYLKTFACPSCGQRMVSGQGVQVEVGKVHLYKQIKVKGWFWGEIYKNKFERTVWRVHGITLYMAPGRHIFNFFALADDLMGNSPGELVCNARGCSWRESGGRYPTQSLGHFLSQLKR